MRHLPALVPGLLALVLPLAVEVEAFPVPAIDTPLARLLCPHAATAPLIDGRLDDDAWSGTSWSADFIDIQGDAQPAPRYRTRVRLLWDDNYLYVGAELHEPHVWANPAGYEPAGQQDNAFVVFIDPDGDNHSCCRWEINALNTVSEQLLTRPHRDDATAVQAGHLPGLRTAVAVDGTLNDPSDRDRCWSVEIAVPWRDLAATAGRAVPPAVNDVWRLNFARVQWRTRIRDGRYLKITDEQTGRPLPADKWVWSPQGLDSMHYPERWGEVMFVTAPPAGQAWAGNPEHETIIIANALMPLYYRQREFHAEHGRFAADLGELGLGADELPRRRRNGTMTLVAGWQLDMAGGDDWFRARLVTGMVVVTVDHEGRLTRSEP